jgi:hypothetical protein
MYLLIKNLISLKLFKFLNKPLISLLLLIRNLFELIKLFNKSNIIFKQVINIKVYRDQNISTSEDKVFIT